MFMKIFPFHVRGTNGTGSRKSLGCNFRVKGFVKFFLWFEKFFWLVEPLPGLVSPLTFREGAKGKGPTLLRRADGMSRIAANPRRQRLALRNQIRRLPRHRNQA